MTEALQDVIANPEVDALLRELLSRVKGVLGDELIGLYLYGSLATGGFSPHRSDIDFVVITRSSLADETVEKLREMHSELAASQYPWAPKLEGSYVPQDAIRRHNPNDPAVPTINEGRFYSARLGSDWIIQRRVLRESGAMLEGPPLVHLIDPVTSQELRESVRSGLMEWWQPMMGNPSHLERPEYQPYAVLSMCRALYTLETGNLVSKDDAASWALRELEGKWSDLVREAKDWKRGEPMGDIEQTAQFIRYTIDKSRELS